MRDGMQEWYIQDPAGGPYSGVSVYCNKTAKSNPCPMTLTPPALHDLVQVTGKLSTYKGKIELQLTGTFTVDSVTPQACYDTQCGGDAGVNGLCTGCTPPTYSGFQVSDGSGHEILVENTFYLSEHLTSSPECVAMAATGMAITTGKTLTRRHPASASAYAFRRA
jgi:hypothetical protein